jgi:hypothetical protein
MARMNGRTIRRELNVHDIERQWMTERNEVGGPLRATDAGKARGDERIALRTAPVEQDGQHVGPHPHG